MACLIKFNKNISFGELYHLFLWLTFHLATYFWHYFYKLLILFHFWFLFISTFRSGVISFQPISECFIHFMSWLFGKGLNFIFINLYNAIYFLFSLLKLIQIYFFSLLLWVVVSILFIVLDFGLFTYWLNLFCIHYINFYLNKLWSRNLFLFINITTQFIFEYFYIR